MSIPVIAHGGPGKLGHTAEAILKGDAHAVALASVLHYDFIQNVVSNHSNKEGNIEFLKSGKVFSKIVPCSLMEVKNYYKALGINVRI